MTTSIDASTALAVTHGFKVTRATATVAADADIFSCSGWVLLTGFIGVVTTEIGAGSQDIEFDFDPDDGSANVALSTLCACDGDVVNTTYTLNPTAGGALVPLLGPAYHAILTVPILLPAGDIVMDVTGAEAGSVEWTVTYIPWEQGATITAV